MLTPELLGELERRWRERGWRGIQRLQPGLDDEEIQAITAPLGLQLPVEASRWWGWHNGISSSGGGWDTIFGGPNLRYLTLSAAVTEYLSRREIAATLGRDSEADGYGQDDWWHPSWFPITEGNGRTIACDCSVPAGAPTPIRSVGWDADEAFSFAEPRVASFGELLLQWFDAIDRGAWTYDADKDRWRHDWTQLDPQSELKRLT